MGTCYREEAVPEGSSTPRMAERSRVATRQSITPWRRTVVAAGYEQNSTYQDYAKSPTFFALSRDATQDGLVRLENKGLIRVQRRPGQRPMVWLLPESTDTTDPNPALESAP